VLQKRFEIISASRIMTTETKSPHTQIFASRVLKAPVLNPAGERLGHVDDLSINKQTGEAVYAILSFGGFLGIGERWHPVPWSVLDYDPVKAGYVIPLTKEELEKAPSLSREELEELGAGDAWRVRLFEYYGPYGAPPFI
jgi:hypothetical protein